MSLEPGSHVGRYRVTRLIAQGGMAEVYRAEQELTGSILRPAALKVIRPEYSESADFREMFLDEARLACTLSHPNIVHIYEIGESDGRLYMAMELVPGESLAYVARTLREKGERLSDEALIAIGIATCSALELVHSLRLPGEGHVNLVHRDVSPHNLLLGPTGSLKLIDFGIAKAASNRNLTMPGVTKGKAGYFSPEQAMGKALDGRSDLFSLGVTLYKLAWGGTPFDDHKTHHERNTALVHGRWAPLRDVCPGLPERFYSIVDRALKVKADDRFANAAEMRIELERLALESGFHVGPSTLAGYVEPQADDPMALGARPAPGSARHARPAAVTMQAQKATVAAATAQAPATGVALSRSAAKPHPSSGLSPRRTERLQPQAVTDPRVVAKTRRTLFLASGVAVVVIATVIGLIVGTRAAREEQPPPAPVAVVAPAPAPAPEPAPVEEAPPPTTVEIAVIEEAEPAPTPQPVKRATKKERAAPVELVAEKPVLKGDGRLRIGGDDGEVEVNGARWGQAPLDRKVPAGTYSVVVKSLDGSQRLSQSVDVRPDRTALVRFDFGKGAMVVSGN